MRSPGMDDRHADLGPLRAAGAEHAQERVAGGHALHAVGGGGGGGQRQAATATGAAAPLANMAKTVCVARWCGPRAPSDTRCRRWGWSG